MAKTITEEGVYRAPTPVVGWPVQYFLPGDITQDNPVAAMVTKIESPGRLAVVVFKPNAMPQHKGAVYHISHPNVQDGSWRNQHTWDFLPGHPGKGVYELADAEIAKKEAAQAIAAQQAAEVEARVQKRKDAVMAANRQNPVIPEAR